MNERMEKLCANILPKVFNPWQTPDPPWTTLHRLHPSTTFPHCAKLAFNKFQWLFLLIWVTAQHLLNLCFCQLNIKTHMQNRHQGTNLNWIRANYDLQPEGISLTFVYKMEIAWLCDYFRVLLNTPRKTFFFPSVRNDKNIWHCSEEHSQTVRLRLMVICVGNITYGSWRA